MLGTISAVLLGIAKTGVPGIGMFGALLMIMAFPGHEMFAAGAVVPLLLVGDFTAVHYYRKDTKWPILGRLFAPLAAGLLAGTVLLCFMTNRDFRLSVGILVTAILCFEILRERMRWDRLAKSRFFGYLCGVLTGLTTMLGNAAGPVLTAYFASQKLSKTDFMGTNAVTCLLMNLSKLPLLLLVTVLKAGMGGNPADTQIITPTTFYLTLMFFPWLILGLIIGRKVFTFIPERYFVPLVMSLNFAAAVQILISAFA